MSQKARYLQETKSCVSKFRIEDCDKWNFKKATAIVCRPRLPCRAKSEFGKKRKEAADLSTEKANLLVRAAESSSRCNGKEKDRYIKLQISSSI